MKEIVIKSTEAEAALAVTSRVADTLFKRYLGNKIFNFADPRQLTIDFNSGLKSPTVSLGREVALPTGVEVFVGSWFMVNDPENEPAYPLIRAKLIGDKEEGSYLFGFIPSIQRTDSFL